MTLPGLCPGQDACLWTMSKPETSLTTSFSCLRFREEEGLSGVMLSRGERQRSCDRGGKPRLLWVAGIACGGRGQAGGRKDHTAFGSREGERPVGELAEQGDED